MPGEEWVWGMLKKALKLSDDDVAQLREGLLSFKDMGPVYLRRAEMTERRVLAIAYYLKEKDQALWDACELRAQQYFARRALADEKAKSGPATVEKL